MSENAAYGTGFYKAISADLQDIFPDVHSFSVTNLKYMRYFYDLYPSADVIAAENRPQTEDDSPALTNRPQVGDDSGEVAIRQQTVDELPEDTIFRIPWGHHVAIINYPSRAMSSSRDMAERLRPSPLRISSARSCLSCCSFRIFSSMVSFPISL